MAKKGEFSTVFIINLILGARPKSGILVLLKEADPRPTMIGKRLRKVGIQQLKDG